MRNSAEMLRNSKTGDFTKKKFNGHFNIDDPKLKINDLDGMLDFSGEDMIINAVADVEYADLKQLGISKNNIGLKGSLNVNFEGNNIDENTVVLLSGVDIDAGKGLYVANCSACHGDKGQGGVGPNFADEYWIHGGSISDVFKSIKYGWVDKGMKPWKDDFSPKQIAQLTSYVESFKGTNPPNPKDKQGDLYVEKSTNSVVVDSTKMEIAQK